MSAFKLAPVYALLSLGCLFGSGCAGTETGNPPGKFSSSLTLSAVSSAPDAVALGQAQGGLLVERAVVNITAISLLPCAGGAPLPVVTARTFDLLAAPAPETLSADGALCGLHVELAPASDDSSGVPLGASLFLRGQRTDGSPFEVVSSAARGLDLEAVDPAGFGQLPLLLGFDVGVWFSGVDVHGAHAGADGVARLDATLNADLLAAFDARTSLSVALYADPNADGVLSASEARPIATSP
jgi:hypothetical protein